MLIRPGRYKKWKKNEKTQNSSVSLQGNKTRIEELMSHNLHWYIKCVKSFNWMCGLNIFALKIETYGHL